MKKLTRRTLITQTSLGTGAVGVLAIAASLRPFQQSHNLQQYLRECRETLDDTKLRSHVQFQPALP